MLGSTGARAIAAVMKRSDAADFHAELNVSALLQGQAELGAAGKLQSDIIDNNALEILPHFTAGLKVAWEYSTVDGQGGVPAPQLHLTKPMFCIGSFLAKLTQQTFSEIDKVLKPLNDVLGQNGILTKDIDVAKCVATVFVYRFLLVLRLFCVFLLFWFRALCGLLTAPPRGWFCHLWRRWLGGFLFSNLTSVNGYRTLTWSATSHTGTSLESP